ncbi:MAG: 30S ribosomal protein S8 [Oceanococcaceae bacterium]
MSMTDPVADMLTRIRNAQRTNAKSVMIPASKLKRSILEVLRDEGYVGAISESGEGAKRSFQVELRYFEGKPVIESIQRVSKPSLRVFKSVKELPSVLGGLGVAIISTSKGVVADRKARELGQGGEVLCIVS